MPKVSVIIPIYNAEQYLRACLDSVVGQTLQDIEIICINDGSTDGSLTILEEYASKDARLHIISKKNEGLVAARKTGVLFANSEYIGYVDSDDWVEPDMFEKMYAKMKEYDVELLCTGYFLEGSYTTVHLDTVEEGLYNEEKMEWLRNNNIYRLEKKETGLRGGLWCKMYRRDLLLEAQLDVPDNITIAEDKVCLLHCLLHCNSVYVEKKAYYHWCIHQESMSRIENPDYLLCVHAVYKYLISLYHHENFTEQMRTQVEIYIMELLTLGMNSRLGFQNQQLFWIDPYWLDKLPKNVRVVLYGGGEYGEKYRQQMASRKDLIPVKELGFSLPTEQELKEITFDYLVIAIKNQGKAEQVKQDLIKLGVPEEKLLWFYQPEMFWRYVEAAGLLS